MQPDNLIRNSIYAASRLVGKVTHLQRTCSLQNRNIVTTNKIQFSRRIFSARLPNWYERPVFDLDSLNR